MHRVLALTVLITTILMVGCTTQSATPPPPLPTSTQTTMLTVVVATPTATTTPVPFTPVATATPVPTHIPIPPARLVVKAEVSHTSVPRGALTPVTYTVTLVNGGASAYTVATLLLPEGLLVAEGTMLNAEGRPTWEGIVAGTPQVWVVTTFTGLRLPSVLDTMVRYKVAEQPPVLFRLVTQVGAEDVSPQQSAPLLPATYDDVLQKTGQVVTALTQDDNEIWENVRCSEIAAVALYRGARQIQTSPTQTEGINLTEIEVGEDGTIFVFLRERDVGIIPLVTLRLAPSDGAPEGVCVQALGFAPTLDGTP